MLSWSVEVSWVTAMSMGRNNICLGMHGKNNDKDKVLKLSVIKEYQKKFLSSSEIIYELLISIFLSKYMY